MRKKDSPIRWFETRHDFERATEEIHRRCVIEDGISASDHLHGYCVACNGAVDFEVRRSPRWTNLREAIVCPRCQLNGRMRMLVHALEEIPFLSRRRFHIMERFTPLYVYLGDRYPNLTGSEFIGPDHAPGSHHRLSGLEAIEVEHQDFARLSFADGSIDVLVHGDVLEHVPDPLTALREAARALAPGGIMLFSVPFPGLDQHRIRARIEGTAVRHLLHPIHHGNPLHPEKGSLVFTEPGWPLLDDMRAAGFSRAEIGLLYDPAQGILSDNNPCADCFMWPVIFRAVH